MIGFKPLKDGRIHLECGQCGRKKSNMPRQIYDPPAAVVSIVLCPKCADESDGNAEGHYKKADGSYTTSEENRAAAYGEVASVPEKEEKTL